MAGDGLADDRFPDFYSTTSASTIPLLAKGSDADGDFKGIQFYVNGIPFGPEILRTPTQSPEDFIYGTTWPVGSPGIHTVFAIGRDNSGNYVASKIESITATSGINPPFKPQFLLPSSTDNGTFFDAGESQSLK